jgi:hypothetical protein
VVVPAVHRGRESRPLRADGGSRAAVHPCLRCAGSPGDGLAPKRCKPRRWNCREARPPRREPRRETAWR